MTVIKNYQHKHLDKLLSQLDSKLGAYESWGLSKAEYCQICLLLKILEALQEIKTQMKSTQ